MYQLKGKNGKIRETVNNNASIGINGKIRETVNNNASIGINGKIRETVNNNASIGINRLIFQARIPNHQITYCMFKPSAILFINNRSNVSGEGGSFVSFPIFKSILFFVN